MISENEPQNTQEDDVLEHSPKGPVIAQEVFIMQGINSNNRIYPLMISLCGRKFLAFYMRSRLVLKLFTAASLSA
jgi:hypothetical protein